MSNLEKNIEVYLHRQQQQQQTQTPAPALFVLPPVAASTATTPSHRRTPSRSGARGDSTPFFAGLSQTPSRRSSGVWSIADAVAEAARSPAPLSARPGRTPPPVRGSGYVLTPRRAQSQTPIARRTIDPPTSAMALSKEICASPTWKRPLAELTNTNRDSRPVPKLDLGGEGKRERALREQLDDLARLEEQLVRELSGSAAEYATV